MSQLSFLYFPRMLLLRSTPLEPGRGPYFARSGKVSKALFWSVEEGRSGGKFFRFNSVVDFNRVPFCLSAIEITFFSTEKFTLLQFGLRVKFTHNSI
jgi:hypothetical protein